MSALDRQCDICGQPCKEWGNWHANWRERCARHENERRARQGKPIWGDLVSRPAQTREEAGESRMDYEREGDQ